MATPSDLENASADPGSIIARGQKLIQVTDVSKIYALKRETVYALNKVTLEVFRSEYLSIMGPSGSGKSTLFNIIGALDKPSEGNVEIGPLSLPKLNSRQLAYVRCNYIGYVFQAYNLIPSLTAVKNVSLPAVFQGLTPEEADERAAKRLTQVGLGHRLTHRPDELSGGQQQRVAIARALVNDPTIILADEPTANLDLNTGAEIIEIFKNLTRDEGVTIITTTHDHKMLANSDRIIWVKDGKVDKIKTADEIDIAEGTIEVGGHAIDH
jgi:putative ABC transport system ATP-binding protein